MRSFDDPDAESRSEGKRGCKRAVKSRTDRVDPHCGHMNQWGIEMLTQVIVLGELQTEVPSVFRILSEPVYAASFCCMTQSS
jgi:hypothetical protein